MNIGIDVKCLARNYTGISIYCADIIKYLTLIDNKNYYILYSNKEVKLDFELPSNFKLKIVNSKKGTIFVRYKLKKILIKDKIDIFWGPDHCIPLKSKHYKTFLTVHDLAILQYKKISTVRNTFWIKFFLNKMCREATKILAVSNTTKDDIKKFYHIYNKVEVVYAGDSPYRNKEKSYSIEQQDNILNKFGIDNKYMLFVSTIEPRKNVINIVKAFNIFKEDNNEYKLVLAGSIGWRADSILEEINNSKYKKDIILTDYVSSLEKEVLYRNANFLVFPSLYEGFGIPLLEAMSIGIPVLTSNVSGMKEVAHDIGFMVDDPLDYKEIASKMSCITKLTLEEINNIKKKSIERSYEFTRENSARQIVDLINQCKKEV